MSGAVLLKDDVNDGHPYALADLNSQLEEAIATFLAGDETALQRIEDLAAKREDLLLPNFLKVS